MRLIIAGSRKLMTGAAAFASPLLFALEAQDSVLLRSPMEGPPGEFERDVAQMCDLNAVAYEWFRPQPTEDTPGRASVFVRDMDMVAAADEAVLFFTPDDVAEGYSGTMHLLEKALEADLKVTAFSVNEEGVVTRVGEYEGRVS